MTLKIRFVSSCAHVFVILSVVIVTPPSCPVNVLCLGRISVNRVSTKQEYRYAQKQQYRLNLGNSIQCQQPGIFTELTNNSEVAY